MAGWILLYLGDLSRYKAKAQASVEGGAAGK